MIFPWGGHVALKSGYESSGLWAFFDAGLAYGTSGHAHKAKLMLNVRAHGAMLLVDSGRFSYQGVGLSVTLNREYERETHSHNTCTYTECETMLCTLRGGVPSVPSRWPCHDMHVS